MAIRNLIVRAQLDAAGITHGQQQIVRQFSLLRSQIRNSLGGTAPLFPNVGAQGQRAAEDIIRGIRTTFNARASTLSQELAAKAINPVQFANRMAFAGAQMNQRLLAAVSVLRGRGLLTPEIENAITRQFSALGFRAGRQTAGTIAAGVTAFSPDIERALSESLANGVRASGGLIRQQIAATMTDVGQQLRSVGTALTLAVTVPILAIGKSVINTSAEFEQLRLSLQALNGSAHETGQQMKDLQQLARLPGIGFREAIQGSVRLQVVGQSAEKASVLLREFSNAIALSGGGRQQLERVTLQLQQMAAAGRVLQLDLRPIIQQAPAAGKALFDAFHTISPAEIESLGLGMDEFLHQWVLAMQGLPRAMSGVRNALDNLGDTAERAKARLGDSLAPAFITLVTQLEDAAKAVEEMDAAQLRSIASYGLAAAAVGPLLFVLGLLLGLVALLVIAFGSFYGAVALIGTILGAGILAKFIQSWIRTKIETLSAANAVRAFNAAMTNAITSARNLDVLRDQLEAINIQLAKLPGGTTGITSLSTAIGLDPGTAAELKRLQDLKAQVEAEIAKRLGTPAGQLLETKLAETERLRLLKEQQEAEDAARKIISDQVDLLAEAHKLGLLRIEDVQAVFDLERRLSAELATSRSLSRRSFLKEQIQNLPQFQPGVLGVNGRLVSAPTAANVRIAGVVIENPAEVQAAYLEAIKPILEETKIKTGLRLRVVEIPKTAFQQELEDIARRESAVTRAQEATKVFNENIEASKELLTAFSDLAGLSGVLGDEFKGAISGIGTFLSGLQRVRFGTELFEIGDELGSSTIKNQGHLATISGLVSMGVAIVQVVDALTGESEAHKQHRKIVQETTDSVALFKAELDGFNVEAGGTLIRITEGLRDFLASGDKFRRIVMAIRETHFGPFFTGIRPETGERQQELLDVQLRQFGTSLAEVKALAESFNIPLFDEEGRIIAENFQLLVDAATAAAGALTGFRNTLDDLAQERDIRNRIQGVELDPMQEWAGFINDLKNSSPGLFDTFFADIDLTDVVASRAALLTMFDAWIKGGDEFLAMMGPNVTRADFLQWISNGADSLAAFDAVVRETTTSLRGVPEVFNFTLESLRAAGSREWQPPTRGPQSPGFPDATVSSGGVITIGTINIETQITETKDMAAGAIEALDRIARELATKGRKMSAAEGTALLAEIKAALAIAAPTRGQASRDLALAWPG